MALLLNRADASCREVGGEKQLWHEPTNTFARFHEVVFMNKRNVKKKKKQAISETSLPCDVCVPLAFK